MTYGESAVEEIEETVDLTLPTPSPKKKKLITEFFKPTKRLPQSGGTLYFLQRYNPRPAPASGLATGHSSTLLSSSKGPTTEVSTDGKKKGSGTKCGKQDLHTVEEVGGTALCSQFL